jgi:hypothetical protein
MLQRLTSRIRRPVKRQGAEQYLLVTLLSFAASVSLTRLFLDLTGYPQLGGGELHIAHALWGGLFLYVASLLPLVMANRWAYLVSAVLAGTGVGLFIDEIGKFITQSNDYFYPLAAPIVYAFFLLSVMLYLRVRRPPSRSVRAELYRAFDALEEVLEQDLDPDERDALAERLRYVAAHGDRPDLTRLAIALLDFVRAETLELAPHRPGLTARWLQRWRALEQNWMARQRLRLMLAGGLFGLGVVTLAKTGLAVFLIALVTLASSPAADTPGAMAAMVRDFVATWDFSVPRGVFRYTDLVLESGVSVLLLLAGGLLVTGRERAGTALAWVGLLLSLTAVNLLVFYYDQFSSILTALIQLVLLGGLALYRQRFLTEPPAADSDAASSQPEEPEGEHVAGDE